MYRGEWIESTSGLYVSPNTEEMFREALCLQEELISQILEARISRDIILELYLYDWLDYIKHIVLITQPYYWLCDAKSYEYAKNN